jgi:hypothetical protein
MDQLAGTAYDVVAVDGVPVLEGTRPDQMEQEQRVLAALSRDLRLVAGEADDELRLMADDGEVLLRRRAEAPPRPVDPA